MEEEWNMNEKDDVNEEKLVRASELWSNIEMLTANASQRLCEQLRLILEPTMATKLKGDYRTGKRINMRKIIPYIASSYRKDKIWLRRKKPSKREYQIMIAIDDTVSMQNKCKPKRASSSLTSSSNSSNPSAGSIALEALSLIGNALTRLEVGEMSVVSFGENQPKMLHPFGSQFTSDSGADITSNFTFSGTSEKGNMVNSVEWICHQLKVAKEQANNENSQLVFLITDALECKPEDLMKLKKMTRSAKNCLFVLIILDMSVNSDQSILEMKRVTYDSNG